jgi:hypothetical protein
VKKLLLYFIIVVFSYGLETTGTSLNTSKMGPFIPGGLLKDIDYSRFWKEFSVTGKVRFDCGIDNINDGLIGFDAYMIEPTLIAETVREKWRLEFLHVNLDIGDTVKNILQTGVSRSDGGTGRLYSHLFQFPLFSMLFKDQFNGAFCFEQGTTGIVYMSELDPSAGIDLYRLKMMPFVAAMLTEQGLINSIAACLATEAYEHIDTTKKRKGDGKIYKDTMDTFFYVMGCKGLIPIGDYSNNVDPLSASYNVSAGNIHFLTTTSPIFKQTVRSVVNQYSNERWCSPKEGPIPMIMSQYAAQIVRPRVGKVMELGITPPEATFFKNDASTGDNTVLLIWQRRDYSMFAYKCGKR